jgi:hypothetical protein
MSTASTRKMKKSGCSDFAGPECHQGRGKRVKRKKIINPLVFLCAFVAIFTAAHGCVFIANAPSICYNGSR